MPVQMNVQQAFHIKKLLAERRLNITALAHRLEEPYGSVANTIYGHRRNQELQAKIAKFLGHSPDELFGSNGAESQGRESGQGLDEVSHG